MKNVILITIDTLRRDAFGCYGNGAWINASGSTGLTQRDPTRRLHSPES
jgi:hypothetical protein